MDVVYIVQHCQSQHHVDGSKRFPDRDNGLTAHGRRQARAVADRFREWFPDAQIALHSSDMARAKETADILGSELGSELTYHSGLREWSDPRVLERVDPITMRDPEEGESIFDWRPCPEHETWREFLARVSDCMNRLDSESTEGSVPILVVHGGTVSNLVVWWLGIPLDVLPELHCFAASPGSISVLRRNKWGNAVVDRLNDRSHLLALDG